MTKKVEKLIVLCSISKGDKMSEKVGRTFYDIFAENKIPVLLLATLIAVAVYKGYKVTFPGGFVFPEKRRFCFGLLSWLACLTKCDC
jgi:hypothetical protein